MTPNQAQLLYFDARFTVNVGDIKIKLVQTPDELIFRIGKIQTLEMGPKAIECETAFNIYDAVLIWHRMMYEEIELQTGVKMDSYMIQPKKAA